VPTLVEEGELLVSADERRSSRTPTGTSAAQLPGRRTNDAVRERRLLRAARSGDGRARARLVDRHLELVRAIARRYRGYGVSIDDLVQEGAIGLLEAIDGYDVDRSPAFEPYARFRVRRAIRNALTSQARLIRLPKHVVERRRALDRAEASLCAAGKRPTPQDLAAATGLPVSAVLEARSVTQPPVSLDEPLAADGSALVSVVHDRTTSNPFVETVEQDERARLRCALARLPERQRAIVAAQWGLDGAEIANATTIARRLKLSPRRTQTIGHDALRSLRRELELVDQAP
jgi:RNA polymerase primary sigma factor